MRLEKFSKEMDIKCVATNDSHYTLADDAKTQDIVLCIQTGSFIDDKDRMKFASDEFYIKSYAEMKKNFAHNEEALSNTIEVLDKCGLELELGRNFIPDFPVPKGETPFTLEKLAYEGINKRYGVKIKDESGAKR